MASTQTFKVGETVRIKHYTKEELKAFSLSESVFTRYADREYKVTSVEESESESDSDSDSDSDSGEGSKRGATKKYTLGGNPYVWNSVHLESPPPVVFSPPNTLGIDLRAMLTSGHASDVALYVGKREFSAHRFILRARSPYFEGLFSSSMRDADSAGLTVADTEPDVFEQLLVWIYSGEVADDALHTKDMAEHLIMAANRYECGGLKLLCEASLCENLTVDNVAARLVLGEQTEAGALKSACLDFIKPDNFAGVMQTEGWGHVMEVGVELMNEVMGVLAGVPVAGRGSGKTKSKKRTADEAGLSATEKEIEEIRGWKTARLRRELTKRGMYAAGRQAELVRRLECAIRDNAPGGGSSGSSGTGGGSSSSRAR